MSTSSKPKSRAPAHQNRTAFRHNKNSKLTRKIATSASSYGLCDKCTAKIEWRVKYRKYKPLTGPKKCNKCHQKTIKAAYRTVCGGCAGAEGICAGCAQATRVNIKNKETAKDILEEEHAMRKLMKGLTERQRRTLHRRVERGEDEIDVLTKLMGNEQELDSEGESEEEDELTSVDISQKVAEGEPDLKKDDV